MPQKMALVPSGEKPEKKATRITTVASTVAILRLLAQEKQGIGVNALARQLNLTPSSCFNILKSLVAEDFVAFDIKEKRYSLGGGIIALARHAMDPHDTFDLIRSRAEELADAWNLTVGLWRISHQRIVLVGYLTGAKTMRIHLTVGQRLPLMAGAIGRLIAASGMTVEQITEKFSEMRWEEAPSITSFLEDVELARQRGWSVDQGNFIRGATTLAVPIRRQDDSIQYGLSATMFSGQHREKDFPRLAREMEQVAKWASPRLLLR